MLFKHIYQIFIIAIFIVVIGIYSISQHKNSSKNLLLNFLHDHVSSIPENAISSWYGGETFCLVSGSGSSENVEYSKSFINGINIAYGSNFKFLKTQNFSECPSFATFYILLDKKLSNSEFKEIFREITGVRPTKLPIDLSAQKGFELKIPGHRKRSFIYVNSELTPVHSNKDPIKSILIEELFHALTEFKDTKSDELISVLGKNLNVQYYDEWFNLNPRGLCEIDLFILKLTLGIKKSEIVASGSIISWVRENIKSMNDEIPKIREHLNEFLDRRCSG